MVRRCRTHAALVLVTGAAAMHLACNPRYCEGNPNHDCTLSWDSALPGACTSHDDCTAPAAVCDPASKLCVECVAPDLVDACGGTTPICGDEDVCRACVAHGECASNACLPDGSCTSDDQVAYVDAAGTSNPMCSALMPCTSVTSALATGRPYVRITGTIDEAVTIADQTVTLLATPGAKLTRSNNGLLLEVRGTSQVSIYDLEIGGASGAAGYGLSIPTGSSATVSLTRATVSNNQAGGIVMTAGSLRVTRSTISANPGGGISASGGTLTVSESTITGNAGGGISVTAGATFHITNNFLVRNGNSNNATVGGASLVGTQQSTFEFNTVADNQTMSGAFFSGGVACSIVGLAAPNNIIVRNRVNGDADAANANTNGDCTYPTSHVAQAITGLRFVSADDAPYDYHLMPGSTAIDQATTATTVTNDIDGEPRPRGAAPDQGADEVR